MYLIYNERITVFIIGVSMLFTVGLGFTAEMTPSDGQLSPNDNQNYIFNGGYEAGLWGWTMWDGDNGWHGRYYFSAVTGSNQYVHGGTSAVVISCGKPGQGGIFQKLRTPLEKGKYALRFYVRGHQSQGVVDTTVQVVWSFANKDGDIAQPGRGERYDVQDKWTLMEFPIEVTSDSVADVTLCLMSWGGGNLVIDDVSLVPTDGRKRPKQKLADKPKWEYDYNKSPKVKICGETIQVNDQPWFPIGVYGAEPEVLANSGFDLIYPYADPFTSEFLDRCEQNNVWVTPDLGSVVRLNAPSADMRTQLENALAGIKGHPAIVAWHLADEPDWRYGVPPATMRQATKIMSELDSCPTWAVIMRPSNNGSYAETLDILSNDVYPGNDPVPIIQATESARKATNGKRPVWMVLQAGGISSQMMTVHAYSALVHGATGLLYFDYSSANSTPENWNALIALSLELKQLTTIVTSKTSDLQPKADHDSIHILLKQDGDNIYLLALNVGGQSLTTVRIQVPDMVVEGQNVEVLFENRAIKAGDEVLMDDFSSYARHVYRWKK